MSLRRALRKAAKAAIDATGDIAVSCNYESYATTTYDVSAGSDVASYTTRAGVMVVFDQFRIEQIDGEHVKTHDKRALVPALAISGITPTINDRIVTREGTINDGTWVVQAVPTDPAEALFELQVRR